jgi:hypothetical protein
MPFNPLDEKGLAIEDQFRDWSELSPQPYDKDAVDPYTRTRVILMNGAEVESVCSLTSSRDTLTTSRSSARLP